MPDTTQPFTIGTLAKATGVHVETIRFYQLKGLLVTPAKPYGGIRRYQESDAARLRFIKSAQGISKMARTAARRRRLRRGGSWMSGRA
jgi:MerR family transcriptional regulator, mercuric resistance operon regulatory protein